MSTLTPISPLIQNNRLQDGQKLEDMPNTSTVLDGQLMIGNTGTNEFDLSTLTAGTGIAIATAAGSITITASGVLSGNLTRTSSAVSTTSGSFTIIGITSTAAARTVTLQTADAVEGRVYNIKDESGAAGTNFITIDTQGAETIDGVASIDINVNYGVLKVYSDGSNWFTI